MTDVGIDDVTIDERWEFVCPACGRDVRETSRGILARHKTDGQGSTLASAWLRLGEWCPGGGSYRDEGDPIPGSTPRYGEPQWLDANFGHSSIDRVRGYKVMELRHEHDAHTGALVIDITFYWPYGAYGPPPHRKP